MKDFIIKNKKICLLIVIVLATSILIPTFGRYTYNVVHNYILESQGFYFSSSVLDINKNEYKINNWDGVNSYPITIDVNNRKNQLLSTKSDISYDINVDCSSNVTCTVNKESGIIYKDGDGNDSYVINITPKGKIEDDEEVIVNTSVVSTSPYKKELSAKYVIGIEKLGFSYKINDNENDKTLTLELVNSISYYEVKEAFDDYEVGDKISYENYKLLSDNNKNKCFSSTVTIEFDPNILLLDMSNVNYTNRYLNSEKIEKIDDYDYIKGFTFDVSANSSQKIIFYKVDPSNNYSYPIVNDESIIDVDVVTAE